MNNKDELTPEVVLSIQKRQWDLQRNNVYVWDSSLLDSFSRPSNWSGLRCPTSCDPGCEALCHERHVPKTNRDHEIGMCLVEDYYPERFKDA
jgi:hypothetical protein